MKIKSDIILLIRDINVHKKRTRAAKRKYRSSYSNLCTTCFILKKKRKENCFNKVLH